MVSVGYADDQQPHLYCGVRTSYNIIILYNSRCQLRRKYYGCVTKSIKRGYSHNRG